MAEDGGELYPRVPDRIFSLVSTVSQYVGEYAQRVRPHEGRGQFGHATNLLGAQAVRTRLEGMLRSGWAKLTDDERSDVGNIKSTALRLFEETGVIGTFVRADVEKYTDEALSEARRQPYVPYTPPAAKTDAATPK